MTTYSTGQVLRMAAITRTTLLRWLREKKIPEPRILRNGALKVRIWTDRDLERVRKYKEANYRKGRGRKAKPKR